MSLIVPLVIIYGAKLKYNKDYPVHCMRTYHVTVCFLSFVGNRCFPLVYFNICQEISDDARGFSSHSCSDYQEGNKVSSDDYNRQHWHCAYKSYWQTIWNLPFLAMRLVNIDLFIHISISIGHTNWLSQVSEGIRKNSPCPWMVSS